MRNWGAGIHPGAHVGVSLFLWLCCAVVGGIMAAFIGFSAPDDCDDDGYNSYYGSSNCGNFNGSWSRFLGVVILLLLLWLVHFIIFVGACTDTAKRNAAKSKPIMVVAQPPYWPMPQQGWQPPMTQQPTTQQQMTQQPMTQQVYPPQPTYYQQPQLQGMPVQPQASPPPASGHAQGSGNGKQPEVAQQSTPADHGVREFYNPAGSSSAA